MLDWIRSNPLVATGGLAGLGILATLTYNIWQDHRRLQISLTPIRWGTVFPADVGGTTHRLFFVVRVTAFNPGRTPNRLTLIAAWRDDHQPVGWRLLPIAADVAGADALEIGPNKVLERDVVIDAADRVPDVREAFRQVSTIGIEVRGRPWRGRSRMEFERDAFAPTK